MLRACGDDAPLELERGEAYTLAAGLPAPSWTRGETCMCASEGPRWPREAQTSTDESDLSAAGEFPAEGSRSCSSSTMTIGLRVVAPASFESESAGEPAAELPVRGVEKPSEGVVSAGEGQPSEPAVLVAVMMPMPMPRVWVPFADCSSAGV